MGFYLEEASCLRYLNHEQIDNLIERRRQWQEIAQQRWVNSRQKYDTILRRHWRPITEKTVSNLHAVAEQLLTTFDKFKLVMTVDQGYVYTNDLALIDALDAMPVLIHKSFTQAVITRAKNTVQLKNPQYQFRSYFRVTKLTLQQKDHLMDFLYNQRGHVRVSPALQRWIDQPFNRTQDYFFVDHNTESWLTMLNLVQPEIIRKTMHIIPAK
jgi:hypothetical protein